MAESEAPGLPANWLNGWLAAIGVTVLLPGVRLAWSDDVVPTAIFTHEDGEPLAPRVAAALPTTEQLRNVSIARERAGCQDLARHVSRAAFKERAAAERTSPDGLLTATVTDLVWGKNANEDDLPHSPFDPPAPKGLTFHDRIAACAETLPATVEERTSTVADTLCGAGLCSPGLGTGFDPRRIQCGVDPVVELVAAAALSLFPALGNGSRDSARCWSGPRSRRGSFSWPVWGVPLDRWGVDALLGLHPWSPERAHRWSVHGVYGSVPYRPSGSSDTTRAYFAERLW